MSYTALPTAICPLPLVKRELLPRWLQPWTESLEIYGPLSWLAWLFMSIPSYEISCGEEVKGFIELMGLIQRDSSRSLQEKALLLEAILAYGLASRPSSYYAKDISFPLPCYRAGKLSIEEFTLVQEVRIEKVPMRIFAPCSGSGSPLCLFPGTGGWRRAPGMATQILDDLNPRAPGFYLLQGLSSHFAKILKGWNEQCGEKAVVVGHSLGAILTIAFAVEQPHLIQHAEAFSPARPFPGTIKKWKAMQEVAQVEALPILNTYIPEWKNGIDPLAFLGSSWIGNLYYIRYAASTNFIGRHALFLIPGAKERLDYSLIQPPSKGWLQNKSWVLLQRLAATMLLITALPCITLKRMLTLPYSVFTSIRERFLRRS